MLHYELLRDGTDVGGQTFGSVVVQIDKQTVGAEEGGVVVENFVAFSRGSQRPHRAGRRVDEETDSAGEDVQEERFVDF